MALHIALDVDGVLADVMTAWLALTNPGRLAPLYMHDMSSWDFWLKHGIKKRDFYKQLNSCWDSWKSIPPTETDLANATQTLSKLGDTVDIVTARSPSTNNNVKLWLKEQGILYNKYVSVASGHMKSDLDYDVFIDDSPINAQAFLSKGKKTILYNQPWNADVAVHNTQKIIRILSLKNAPCAMRKLGLL